MSKELTVIIKDDDKTCKQKFLIYDNFTMKEDDPTVAECIRLSKENFKGSPDSIQLRCLMVIQ